jgi:hypothetical protein
MCPHDAAAFAAHAEHVASSARLKHGTHGVFMMCACVLQSVSSLVPGAPQSVGAFALIMPPVPQRMRRSGRWSFVRMCRTIVLGVGAVFTTPPRPG